MEVRINIDDSESMLDCLSSVLLGADKAAMSPDEEIVMDLTAIRKPPPAFAIPLLMFLRPFKDRIKLSISKELKELCFPEGLDSGSVRLSALKALMQGYAGKRHIPLVKFPANRNDEEQTANILTVVENILVQQLDGWKNVQTGLRYIVGEWVDNITQHARSEFGYIHAATNPEKKYMDICLADEGITLLGSYKENNDNDIVDDMEALKAANRGISTKNLPDAVNRGYGIITSKKMLTDGLGGLFIMLSGSAMLIKSENFNEYIGLPDGLRCNGTMILCRMPYDCKGFNYINFVE